MINYNKLLQSVPERPLCMQLPPLRRSYNTTCIKCDMASTCGYDVQLCVNCVRPLDIDWNAYRNYDERWTRGNDWFQERIKIQSYWFKAKRMFREFDLPTTIQALIIEYVTDSMGNQGYIDRCVSQNKIPKITNNCATDITIIPSRVLERIRLRKEYAIWKRFVCRRNKYCSDITTAMLSILPQKAIYIVIEMLFEPDIEDEDSWFNEYQTYENLSLYNNIDDFM